MSAALMMLLAAHAAGPETAVDAERAFYRAAQTDGQWTAFRRFATDDAVMFTPQPVRAQEVLPKKDPPIAVQWWPAHSYVSCDGTVAVNTGPWVRPNGSGYFSTVWERQADGHWKWVMDHGDGLSAPRPLPEEPKVRRAACKFPRGKVVGVTFGEEPGEHGQGISDDGTLAWIWRVRPDGSRTFTARLWNGRKFETVVRDEVAAPAAS
ncbi:hypothetical protein ACFQ1E_02155 [Sphingomonas canadensis]|uniref:DUF4440 domain-containing protein n=1 Tax=Sphingomonas canadensis TaxID=1219257 RepID=A0ABW3H1W9_9SPHN|nr:hypothetical protein [Sphingomonas canadensis]MCW3834956.1 hypothetical protein [Sphingomonas canadensis]